MPIRINLKELFPSDSQDITVDKLNFNFNKLLALGVGDQGDQGVSGPQGSAGPVGLSGLQGLRGSTWYVDSGDPNTLTFVDLIDNDLYLDTATFSVWQYTASSSTWSQVLNFSSIVSFYISQTPSPFNRGFGITSQDDRFITFNRRGNNYPNSQTDVNRGSFNTANSDVLFLNNFNETTISNAIGFPNFLTSPGDVFDALLKIYVNHTEGVSEVTGRYHLELGSLYLDTSVPPETTFSNLRNNLKVKFKKNNVSLTTGLTNTNTFVNISQFSMSVPEPEPISGILQNGIFEFVMPKWNNETTPIQDEIRVWLGSTEGVQEYVSFTEKEIGDGIVITDSTSAASFGIMKDLGNNFTIPYADDDFLLINTDSLDGVFINSKTVQTNGTFDVIHTNSARFKSKTATASTHDANANKHLSSIFSNGNLLISTWAGSASSVLQDGSYHGIININQLDSSLTLIENQQNTSLYLTAVVPFYDNHGHQIDGIYGGFPATNLTHVDFVGKYLYATRIRPQTLIAAVGTDYNYNTLLISELDSSGNLLQTVGLWGTTSADEYYAKKVQVVGSVAYVLTKKQATSDWTSTASYLHAVDVTNPTSPATLDKVTVSSVHNFLDFVILNERAYISSYDDSANAIKLIKIDIHDPSNLVAGTNPTTVLASGATERPAPIKADGARVYVGYGSRIYAYSTDNLNNSSMASLISGGYVVDASLQISDILVNGNYMYVLGENSTNNYGELYTLDITTVSAPIKVGFDSRSDLTAPGKMTLVGNKIYATNSQGTGGLSATDGGLSVFELDGIVSPTADLSTLKSNEAKISNNLYVGEKLDVGNSVNVGSGGVYIDQGVGLAVDGPTKILGAVELLSGNISFSQFSRAWVKMSSSQTLTSNILTYYTVNFDTTEYDTLSEFTLSNDRFTATYDGYYSFDFRAILRHSNSLQEHRYLLSNIKLTDSNANNYDLYTIGVLATAPTSPSVYLNRLDVYTIAGSKTINLSAGDYVQVKIQCYAQDGSGVAIDLSIYSSELTINRIG